MMENGKRQPRRQLSPEEMREIFLEGHLAGDLAVDAARMDGVDVSVICLTLIKALTADSRLLPRRQPSAKI